MKVVRETTWRGNGEENRGEEMESIIVERKEQLS
jgi:hypothetical protein